MIQVSILLPTYNGAKTIARAIESVLSQTHTAWELLVIDDGSSDGTAQVVKKYVDTDSRVRYIKNERNLGIQKTLNRGLKEAKGEYIARIDDDDFWIIPYKLSAQYAYMQLHPGCVLVGTGVVVYSEDTQELFRYILPESDADIRKNILSKNCFTHATVLFSKQAAQECGGYGEGEETKHVEDYDLWLRLGTKGSMNNLPLYAVGFTLRAGSTSGKNKTEQFKKDIALTRKYKTNYPGYTRAIIRGTLRSWLYQFFHLIPKDMQESFLGWYKKNW